MGLVTTQERIKSAFRLCVLKTLKNIKRLADEPKSAAFAVDGNYFAWPQDFYEIANWTSSFFTGMALLAWCKTEDRCFLDQVLRLAPHYRRKVFIRYLDTCHDLGFLYSLYSVALYKLTGDREHRKVGLRAAEILSERFNPKGNYIRAWGRMNTSVHENLVIAESLMNLPLLFWASNESADGKYRDIAIRHADTVLKSFFRSDNSVYHAYRFDSKTGQPLEGDNYSGCSVDSHWARGAAWLIYGFALSHSYTRDPKYLDAALRLAKFFVARLDSEMIPMWDFKLTANAPLLRDSSAASVAVCGFQELEKHNTADSEILASKQELLERLCTRDYINFDPAVCGIQRVGQVGDCQLIAKNAYTSWGDYFLMEALSRELGFYGNFW